MSSGIKKMQDRMELKKENAWLRNAFRNAYETAMEQSDNAAELSRALWLAAQQNGGELRVKSGKGLDAILGVVLPIGARLRSYQDEEAGETVFVAHIEEATPAVEDEPSAIAADNAAVEGADAT